MTWRHATCDILGPIMGCDDFRLLFKNNRAPYVENTGQKGVKDNQNFLAGQAGEGNMHGSEHRHGIRQYGHSCLCKK